MNEIVKPSVVAKEAALALYNQTVLAQLVHQDYSAEFDGAKGDTVTIRKPAVFVADEFNGTVSVQNIKEGSVDVKLDKHFDVSVELSAKEMTLDLDDLSVQVVAPAMEAIAQGIDQFIAQVAYQGAYQTSGIAGTTPSTVADVLSPRRTLNESNAPTTNRRLVLDAAADAALLELEAFRSAEKVGDGGSALKEGELGRKFGFDIFGSNNLAAHANGDIAHTGTFATAGAAVTGAATLTIDGTTVTGTWNKGSLLTVDGKTYTVTADAVAAGNAVTVGISPALVADVADNSEVTRIANHDTNLAFHRNGIVLVSRALQVPQGVEASIMNYKGFAIRVVRDYNSTTKTNTISFDTLVGAKVLDPALVVRLLG